MRNHVLIKHNEGFVVDFVIPLDTSRTNFLNFKLFFQTSNHIINSSTNVVIDITRVRIIFNKVEFRCLVYHHLLKFIFACTFCLLKPI